jgi:UrcA family protein
MKPIQSKISSVASLTLLAVAAVLISGCTDALAQERAAPSPSVERSAKVRISDLNLATTAGVKAAEQRIQQAARKLCDQLTEELDVGRHEHYVECIDRTTIAAMRQLNVPSLANLSAKQDSQRSSR